MKDALHTAHLQILNVAVTFLGKPAVHQTLMKRDRDTKTLDDKQSTSQSLSGEEQVGSKYHILGAFNNLEYVSPAVCELSFSFHILLLLRLDGHLSHII